VIFIASSGPFVARCRSGLARLAVRQRSALITLIGFLAAFSIADFARAAASAPAAAQRGMVASSQADASRAGLAMLERGGNAIDAAVAAAFALAVTQPMSTGIGGGAFALIRLASGQVLALDCRETAPAAATRDMYLAPGLRESASLYGGLAVATPGLVAGLAELQARYGTLPLGAVLEPSIRLARDGFAIGPYHAERLEQTRATGLADEFPETGRIQFPPDGQPIHAGWRLVQRDLATTLEAIAKHGADAFYRGPIAERIAEEVAARGGILTREDLASYTPKWRKPVLGNYRGYEVVTFPPPSSGGVALLEMLNVLEGFDLAELGAGSSASIHRIAESMKLAFADRNHWLGDPDFVRVPVDALIAKRYARRQRARINPPFWQRSVLNWGRVESAIEVAGPGLEQNDSGTTHVSVADAAGNAVALTETINTVFGSGVTVPGTGILLNNEMDDFSIAVGRPNVYGLVDQRGQNSIAPGKRPLSSMTPTFLQRDGALAMVTGAPGGPRIITTTLLTILNVVDYRMDAQEAVAAPRFHHQWLPDQISVEPEIPVDVIESLRERGHRVEVGDEHWSSAEVIVVDPSSRWFTGGSDPRRDGLAAGY
jgi:gamma-glutamyltranspeptidase/glutathione hydrolase